jgi:hypothetical protein
MPALIKVYTECADNNAIKLAIEYAASRFYVHHRESFVFQTIDVMSHVVGIKDIDADWLAKSVFALFSSLRRGISPATPDAAGIHNLNKLDERETELVITAEEKPQTFFASIAKAGPKGKEQITVNLPQEHHSNRLGIDDFVRLFLTIIAHDISIARSEQFLRFFRYLAPYIYHSSSSARAILHEGVEALGVILFKISPKAKFNTDVPATRFGEGDNLHLPTMSAMVENQLLEKSRQPSDILAMQTDYMSLIVRYTSMGGELSPPASHRAVELVKNLMREVPVETGGAVTTFLGEFTRTSFIRENLRSIKTLTYYLTDILPLIRNYGLVIDFASVFQTVTELCTLYPSDPDFSRLVAIRLCGAALSACEAAAAKNVLFTLPGRLAIVELVAQAVMLDGADVITQIENRKPTYDFMAGVIYPLVCKMKTAKEFDTSEITSFSRERLVLGFICFIMQWLPVSRRKRRKVHQAENRRDSVAVTVVGQL